MFLYGVRLTVCRWMLPVVALLQAMLPVDAAKYTGGDPEMALSMADAGGSASLIQKTGGFNHV